MIAVSFVRKAFICGLDSMNELNFFRLLQLIVILLVFNAELPEECNEFLQWLKESMELNFFSGIA